MRSLQVTQLDIRKLRATKMTYSISGIVQGEQLNEAQILIDLFITMFNPGRRWTQALTS